MPVYFHISLLLRQTTCIRTESYAAVGSCSFANIFQADGVVVVVVVVARFCFYFDRLLDWWKPTHKPYDRKLMRNLLHAQQTHTLAGSLVFRPYGAFEAIVERWVCSCVHTAAAAFGRDENVFFFSCSFTQKMKVLNAIMENK